MSLVESIDERIESLRERLAKLRAMRELAVEVEEPARERVEVDRPKAGSDPPPAADNGGGTLDGQIIEAVGLKPWSVRGLATKLNAEPESVQARIDALLAEGEVERRPGKGMPMFTRVG